MSVPRLIRRYARKYGVDPRAALAVARTEGGLGYGAVGDAGTSYGPFQLHVGGALPRGRGASWANSPAGIEYAIRSMARAGARGLTGRPAIEAIVRNFERPADPASQIRKALSYYGSTTPSGPVGPAPLDPVLGGAPADDGSLRSSLLRELLTERRKFDPMEFSSRLQELQPSVEPLSLEAPTTSSGSGTSTTTWAPKGGGRRGGKWGVTPQLYDFAKRFNLSITSGYRSVAKQRAIYAGRSAPGSVAAPGKSYHNSGRAIDVSVSAAAKRAYRWALAHPGLFAEAFFDPAGVYIKNGKVVQGRIGGHSDHIHFSLR